MCTLARLPASPKSATTSLQNYNPRQNLQRENLRLWDCPIVTVCLEMHSGWWGCPAAREHHWKASCPPGRKGQPGLIYCETMLGVIMKVSSCPMLTLGLHAFLKKARGRDLLLNCSGPKIWEQHRVFPAGVHPSPNFTSTITQINLLQ